MLKSQREVPISLCCVMKKILEKLYLNDNNIFICMKQKKTIESLKVNNIIDVKMIRKKY